MAEKTWKDKAMRMIYGDEEKPVARKDFTTTKKTLQAAGDEEIPEEVLNKYNEMRKGGALVSLEDLIVDYYGGKENLQKEIEKAKESSKKPRRVISGLPAEIGMAYERIFQKIPVEAGGEEYYYKSGKAYAPDPEAYKEKQARKLASGKSGTEEERKAFKKFLKENVFSLSDFEEGVRNPMSQYIGAVEHEIGHHATGTKTEGKIGKSGTHISDKAELANQLGRIQREAYQLYGERFTPETLENFMKLQKDVPEEERFKSFSPDTRRGLRQIYDSYENESRFLSPEKSIWKTSKERIPEFVKRKEKSDGRTS